MPNPYFLRELTTLPDMAAQYPLLRQLYPALLLGQYEQRLASMIPHGYGQVGVFTGERCVGLSGFWLNTKLYCGPYIEMDNVIVDATHRSTGVGKLLTDWIVEKGRATGCQAALLDAFVQNSRAHQFYFREGYTIIGFHMQRGLDP